MGRDETINDLVREARELRARLSATAALLDAFTEQLQGNVERLKEISTGMTQTGDGDGDGRG